LGFGVGFGFGLDAYSYNKAPTRKTDPAIKIFSKKDVFMIYVLKGSLFDPLVL